MLPVKIVDCPYCGESIELIIDDSIETQQYIEDCSVCCQPIDVYVCIDSGGEIEVRCSTDAEI